MSAISGSSFPGPAPDPNQVRRVAQRSAPDVAPGDGLLSRTRKRIEQLDIVNGIDRATGHGAQTKLSPAFNRYARGDRPGSIGTAESLGPMSGPLA